MPPVATASATLNSAPRRRSRIAAVLLSLAAIGSAGLVTAPAASADTTCDKTDPAATATVAAGGDIQAAIDQVAAAGGGCVNLGSGTWTLSTSILMRSGVSLNGSGDTTLLQGPTTVYGFSLITLIGPEPRTDVTVQNLALNGRIPAAALTTDPDAVNPYGGALGIYFAAFTVDDRNIAVRNVGIKHTSQGIHIKGANGVALDSVTLQWNGIAYWLHNAYLRRTTNVTITNSVMDGSYSGDGLHVAGGYTGLTITGSQFNSNAAHGVLIQDRPADVLVQYCTASENSGDGIGATGDNLVIDANKTRNNAGSGIHTYVGSGSVTNNLTTGNTMNLNIHGTFTVSGNIES